MRESLSLVLTDLHNRLMNNFNYLIISKCEYSDFFAILHIRALLYYNCIINFIRCLNA